MLNATSCASVDPAEQKPVDAEGFSEPRIEPHHEKNRDDDAIDLEKLNAIKNRILMMKDIDEEDITPDLSFVDLNFDSLDYIEMQVVLLSEYGVKIPDEKFSSGEVVTIRDAIALTNKLISANASNEK